MRVGVKSDIGKIREINEDYLKVVSNEKEEIAFVIADGMGGHNAGEVASKIAVEYVSENIHMLFETENSPELLRDSLINLVCQANKAVLENSQNCPENYGMGTTLIVAYPKGSKIHFGHVGDSRAYCVRNGEIFKITTDHSYIEELLRNGTINIEEAKVHPKKNLITRALGYEAELKVDYYVYDVQQGDLFLLCTDGLTNMVSEDTLLWLCKSIENPQELADKLIDLANTNGGDDNISAIVIKID